MAIETWRGEDAPPDGQGWQRYNRSKGEVIYQRVTPEPAPAPVPIFAPIPEPAPIPIQGRTEMATNNSLFGMGGEISTQNVVYGPDGTAYGNPAIAIAAGVTNYTMSPPTSSRAAPAYTQQYIPGNYTPELTDYLGNPLATKYGEPIYSVATDRVPRTLIGRVGMAPVVTPANNERGAPTITFQDDPVYQKNQQILDFEKRIASGEIQESGLYGPQIGSGREIDRRAFVGRESAYQSYDPATDTFRFYDPEGNITQEGPRAGSVLGGALGGLMTGLNQTVANPDFQKAVMLAALAGGAYAGFGVPGVDLGVPGAELGVNALPATGAGVAAGSAPALTPAALESLIGSAGYGTNAAALEAAISAGINPAIVGSGAYNAASLFGGSGSLYDAVASPLASGYGGPSATALTNQAVASGMSPGLFGAEAAAQGGLTAAQLAAASGTVGAGSALEGLATLGNTSALTNLLSQGSGIGSTLSSLGGSASSFLPSLITGGLQTIGAANTAEKAREAAQIQAAAQVEAARIAADAAKFRPVGVTTRFGTSQFTTDAQGNVIGAGYTASPEIQAYQNRLSALAAQGLTGAEGAAAAYAPLTTGAQSLFNLGQGYIQETPEQQAAAYIAKQQALLDPMQQQQLAQLQAKLFAQGRGGVSVAQGGDLAATSPELAAYYNALAQSNLQLAAQGQQAGMEQARFGAGLLGTGSDLMGKYYGGQTAAYAPFATAIDTTTGLENLAQQPMTLGTQIGAKTTASAAEAGRLLSQGMLQSATTQAPVNAFSYSGNLFSQAANNPQLQAAILKAFST